MSHFHHLDERILPSSLPMQEILIQRSTETYYNIYQQLLCEGAVLETFESFAIVRDPTEACCETPPCLGGETGLAASTPRINPEAEPLPQVLFMDYIRRSTCFSSFLQLCLIVHLKRNVYIVPSPRILGDVPKLVYCKT